MNADAAEGTLTTRPMTFTGKHLFVNANTTDGELRAEVLDASGQVVAPFSRENCEPVRKDATTVELRWKGAGDLSALSKEPKRVRFHVRNGALYSFWISADSNGASHGYVAAGGPGFDQPVDTVGLRRREVRPAPAP